MNDPTRTAAALAIAVGVVALGCAASLIAFFLVGGPLGTINDLGNGALGLLSGALAVASWRLGAAPGPGSGGLGTSAAVLGAAVTVAGSVLVISEATGFFLAGLVSSAGFALVGVWLILFNRWIGSDPGPRWPKRRVTLGIVAGAVMTLGLVGLPGVVTGLDDMDAAPVWIHVGGLGWLGTYILLPIWSIWLGRALAGETRRRTPAARREPLR